jgi:hypothetical protein
MEDTMSTFLFMLGNGTGEAFNVATENLMAMDVINAIKQFVPSLKIIYTDNPAESAFILHRRQQDKGSRVQTARQFA